MPLYEFVVIKGLKIILTKRTGEVLFLGIVHPEPGSFFAGQII